MAQYTTNAEFLDQELPTSTFADVGAPTITAALVWASSVANSYLGKRFTLPITVWGEDLKVAVASIAAFRLMKRRGFSPHGGSDEVIIKAHDDAIVWLRDVAKGLVMPDAIVDSTPDLDEEGTLAASDDSVSWRFFTGPRRRNGCCE
jgi:phage gp36-like protein